MKLEIKPKRFAYLIYECKVTTFILIYFILLNIFSYIYVFNKISITLMVIDAVYVLFYIFSLFYANLRWKNISYSASNKKLYINNGVLDKEYNSINLKNIKSSRVIMRFPIDNIFKTGDIEIYTGSNHKIYLMKIENPQDVNNKIHSLINKQNYH